MAINIYRPRALLMLLAAAVLVAGLLALVGAKPAWTADRSFTPAPNSPFSVGSAPTTVTSADFNGDGKADLAVANYSSNDVSVLLGNGDGTFQEKKDFSINPPCSGDLCSVAAMAAPNQVITGFFNGDNKADLATANFGTCFLFCQPGGISVLLGNGDGTFQNAQAYSLGTRRVSRPP